MTFFVGRKVVVGVCQIAISKYRAAWVWGVGGAGRLGGGLGQSGGFG